MGTVIRARAECANAVVAGRASPVCCVCGVEADTPTDARPSSALSLSEECCMPGQSRKCPYKIAILWRGDAETRRTATSANNRYHRIFEELAALGLEPEPAIYDEAFEREVESQLLAADGVLVWVDPLHLGKNR